MYVHVVCGPQSSTVSAPSSVDGVSGILIMDKATISYSLDLFTSSNPSCPVDTYQVAEPQVSSVPPKYAAHVVTADQLSIQQVGTIIPSSVEMTFQEITTPFAFF